METHLKFKTEYNDFGRSFYFGQNNIYGPGLGYIGLLADQDDEMRKVLVFQFSGRLPHM